MRDQAWVVRANRRRLTFDTLAQIAGDEWHRSVDGTPQAQRVSFVEVQLSAPEQAMMFPDGWVALARQRPYRVDWISPAGTVTTGPDLGWREPAVTEVEIDFHLAQLERRLGRTMPAEMRNLPFSASVPAFGAGALQHWRGGQLLVARQPWSGDRGSSYDIVDRSGKAVGRIELPAHVRIVGVSERFVYTASSNEDGIETVRRHRVESSR